MYTRVSEASARLIPFGLTRPGLSVYPPPSVLSVADENNKGRPQPANSRGRTWRCIRCAFTGAGENCDDTAHAIRECVFFGPLREVPINQRFNEVYVYLPMFLSPSLPFSISCIRASVESYKLELSAYVYTVSRAYAEVRDVCTGRAPRTTSVMLYSLYRQATTLASRNFLKCTVE